MQGGGPRPETCPLALPTREAVLAETVTELSLFRSAKARGPAGRMSIAAVLVLLTGCQILDQSSIDPEAFQPSSNPITVESVTRDDRLARIAREQHPRILATYGGEYSDPKLERALAKIIGSLTLDPENPDQTYRITILDSANINAFALPGGYLYLTRGLLALANDSAEIAAVVAHEMAHVTANHGIQRQQREAEEVLATRVVNDVLGGDRGGRLALLRGKLRLAQFSRNQELEADEIGIRSIGRAGFDPFAAARFLRSMAAYADWRSVDGGGNPSLDFLASHPNAPQRIDLAQRHAREFPGAGPFRRDRDAYLAGIDGMIFGDKAEEGYVRGTSFIHPELGVRFDVPEGFVIDNSAAAVTAAGPGDMAIRFDAVELKPGQSLREYMLSGWVAGLDQASIREQSVGGNASVTARAEAEGWQFDVTLIEGRGRVYRLLTASPVRGADPSTVARGVARTFHIMSAREIGAIEPLRVRIVTVRPGDTVATLAARMVGTGKPLELFRLLNALGPGSTVSAGDKVKIVTDR